MADMEDSEYRLPTHISPTHYDLTILTDLEQLKFMGTVEIDLTVSHATSRIVLNVTTDIELRDISLSLPDGQTTLVPISQATDKVSERLTLVFPAALVAGSSAKLFVAFAGALTGSMVGYYRSLTTGPDEDKKYCALTQFEAGVGFNTLLWRFLILSRSRQRRDARSPVGTNLPSRRRFRSA
jgi:aminopeptidase 2